MVVDQFHFFYDQMPEEMMRVFYSEALRAARARRPSFTVPADVLRCSKASVHDLLLYMYGDHPELYDLNIGEYSMEYLPGGNMKVNLFYRNSDADAAKRDARFQSAVHAALAECFPNGWQHLSQLEREKNIFGFLCSQVSYDKVAFDPKIQDCWKNSETDAWSAYGALVQRKAVCHGVACAFKLLCDQVDIPGLIVMGTILKTNERHAWNIVRIDRQFYHVDCTWMLHSSIDRNVPFARYRYFNLPSQLIENERTIEMDYIPECSSLRHNPFYIRKLCVRNAEELRRVILEQLNGGKDRFAVLCIGFSLPWEEIRKMMDQFSIQCRKRLRWYQEGYYIGGHLL